MNAIMTLTAEKQQHVLVIATVTNGSLAVVTALVWTASVRHATRRASGSHDRAG